MLILMADQTKESRLVLVHVLTAIKSWKMLLIKQDLNVALTTGLKAAIL